MLPHGDWETTKQATHSLGGATTPSIGLSDREMVYTGQGHQL